MKITILGPIEIELENGVDFRDAFNTFKEEIRKMFSDQEKALIEAFDNATSNIAAELEALKDPNDAEFNAQLQIRIDALNALGTNPTEPVPAALAKKRK